MLDFFANNYTLIIVVFGTMLLGIAAASIGTITILRRQALIGDALSHATLPGVVLAFMLTGYKEIWVLLLGAAFAATLSISLITIIQKYTKIKNDASLALILSGFFGFGQVLLVVLQGSGNASQAGLNKFIFGQAATILRSDLYFLGIIALALVLLMVLFWKEIKHFIFNKEHFETLGFSTRIVNGLILFLTIIVVVIGIRSVGVILMSALMVSPGVAARQWSNKLSINVILASIIGMLSGAFGAYVSAVNSSLPTGPVVVIFLSLFVIISLLFAPKRGIIYQVRRNKKYQETLIKYKPLVHIYAGNDISLLEQSEIDFLCQEGMLVCNEKDINITEDGVSLLRQLLGGAS